jgi:hypothetical protein
MPSGKTLKYGRVRGHSHFMVPRCPTTAQASAATFLPFNGSVGPHEHVLTLAVGGRTGLAQPARRYQLPVNSGYAFLRPNVRLQPNQ